jgi:nuclear inhibitor of protein phosphatase 1
MPGNPMLVKRKKKTVTFCDEEEIINPEDIDPTIGRFRNMIQTSVVIPNRKKRPMMPPNQFGQYSSQYQPSADLMLKRARQETNTKFTVTSHHDDEDEERETLYDEEYESTQIAGTNSLFITNLGINMPNIAPDVNEDYSTSHTVIHSATSITKEHDLFKQQHLEIINRQFQQQYQYYDHDDHDQNEESIDSKKKKYAKEAWPGRKTVVLPHTNEHEQLQPKRSISPPPSQPLSSTKSIPSVSHPQPPPPSSSSSSSANTKRLII